MLDKKWILLLIISYIVTDEASADRILTRICSGKVCISEEYSKTFHTELPPVIEVELRLNQILSIDLQRRTITLNLHTVLSWEDPWIMADGKNLPVFTPFKKANLWVPDTLILNLRRRIRWDEEQGKLTTMQVTKLPGDKSAKVKEEYVSEVEIGCDMDFHLYPFYNIRCDFNMTIPTKNASDIMFKSPVNGIRLAEHFTFQYDSEYVMDFRPFENGLIVPSTWSSNQKYNMMRTLTGFSIQLKYRPNEAIIILYLPAFLLVLISYLSFFLTLDLVPSKVSHSVGLLLTTVNQFNSFNQSSLKGGKGPTAAAIYLLACLIFSGGCLAINVLIFRYMGDKEKVKKLNLYGGITAITTFLLFNIIYWPLVLSQI